MKHAMNVWVLGGDLRQAKLARLLQEDGHTVHTYALEQAEDTPACQPTLEGVDVADCVVLPLPVVGETGTLHAPLSPSCHPLDEIFDALHPRQIICAGKVSPQVHAMAKARGLVLHDYLAREELAVANAVPTVEGAIQIAMQTLPITLHGARALVIGYGRLGKLLAHRLNLLGAHVSVSARKWSDLAWAEAYGHSVEQTDRLDGWLCSYDLIVNTVPAPVLGEGRLRELKADCLVIDLASSPGGVDREAARQLGVSVIWALSLPGKTAPVTAGKAILSTIYNILREQEV